MAVIVISLSVCKLSTRIIIIMILVICSCLHRSSIIVVTWLRSITFSMSLYSTISVLSSISIAIMFTSRSSCSSSGIIIVIITSMVRRVSMCIINGILFFVRLA